MLKTDAASLVIIRVLDVEMKKKYQLHDFGLAISRLCPFIRS